MCQVLQISRSTYYYESKKIVENEDDLHKKIIDIFHDSYDNYGTRKIKVELEKNRIKGIKKKNWKNYERKWSV